MMKQMLFVGALLLATIASGTPTKHLVADPPPHQQTNTPKLTPKEAAQRLTKELGLNAVQAQKLLKLNEQYPDLIANPRFKGRPQPAEETNEVLAETTTTKGKTPKQIKQEHIKKQHMKRNAYCAKLKKILTPDQYRRYTTP